MEAQARSGVMYADGRGVPQNEETAYMWFFIALNNGYGDAQAYMAYLEVYATANKVKLSPQEIARAKQRAREFLAKQGQ